MRKTARPRRELHPVAFAALRPVLRYSYTRGAWVLVAVGDSWGPVVRPRTGAAGSDPAPPPRRR